MRQKAEEQGLAIIDLADELSGNSKRIETVKDIETTWLEGVRSVGITSAASTPDDLVQTIVRFFQIRNPEVEIIEEAEWENISFRQPKRMPPRAVSSNHKEALFIPDTMAGQGHNL